MYHLGVLVDVLLSQNGLIGVTLRSAPGAASTVSDTLGAGRAEESRC